MKIKIKKEIGNAIIEYTILTVTVLIILCIVYKVWSVDVINIPLSYTGDGIGSLVSEKIMIEEGGLGITCSRIGAPFGQQSYDYTTATIIPVLLMKLGALFTDNWVCALNLSYFSGYFFIAWIAYYILKKFKIIPEYGIVLSVLFTFLPYHMLRGTEHFALAFYAFIPISIYYAVNFMGIEERNLKEIPRKEIVAFLIWMIIIGLNGIYYAFFTCFLFCIAIIYNLLNRNKLKNIIKCIVGIGGIISGILLASIPTFIQIFQNGVNTGTVYRLRSEIATYGLRIAQLLLPITGHRVKLIERIKEVYNNSFPVNENDSASLGIIFAIGFIILLMILIMNKSQPLLKKLAVLNLSMVIYCSVGGLIEIQAIVFKLIRCSNRISIFIAFVCCVGIGIILSTKTGSTNRRYKKICIAVLILLIGIFDQTKADYVYGDEILAQINNQKEFIIAVESKEKDGTMIFQLPNVVYPEQGMKEQMGDYSHFIGYLYSDTLKWSYGALKGRAGSVLLDKISSLPTSDMISSMKEYGFGGIYIDRWGYRIDDLNKLEKEIQNNLNTIPIEDRKKRYVYYSFSNH